MVPPLTLPEPPPEALAELDEPPDDPDELDELLLLEPQAAMAKAATTDTAAPPRRRVFTFFSLSFRVGQSLGRADPICVNDL